MGHLRRVEWQLPQTAPLDRQLLQEKCKEQHRDLHIAFVDLTKAFDTANRSLLQIASSWIV